MQPVSPRINDMLNQALTFELTLVNQYFLNARMLDNWGLNKLGKVFYDLSIGEMKDADLFIQRILMFDGHPNVQKLNNINIGETAEEILKISFDIEVTAVEMFNKLAKEAQDLGDHATSLVFEQAAQEEEEHADWFEGQLDAIRITGAENYFAQQVDAGVGP